MKKGWQWPVVICGFLGLTVIVDITTLYVAATHPTIAAESDYYEKALRWDADQQEREASEQLGWQLEVASFGVDAGGVTALGVHVKGADGGAIHEASLSVEAFHVTRPKDVSVVEFTEAAPGYYMARVPAARRFGPWKLNFRCQLGEAVFFADTTGHLNSR